ncbi:MAG: hypothetical protein CL947_03290 [Epsilonproteobacteria bacterium]|nr:hypothetical protein [Campylobacterota bacterium]
MKHQFFFVLLLFSTTIKPTVFSIKSIYDLMLQDDTIRFYKLHDPIAFEYQPFPLTEQSYWQPHQGALDQSGIFIIPHGKFHPCVYLSADNKITAFQACYTYDKNNNLIKEFLGSDHSLLLQVERLQLKKYPLNSAKKISGKVVIIADIASDFYANWMIKTLAKVAMLQTLNIEYDWICTLHHHKYMKETLQLLGIDASKIIEPILDYECLQADELIVPSVPARFIPPQNNHNYAQAHLMSLYAPSWHLSWLREKFLPLAQQHCSNHNFCTKVFLSRNDAARKINNEDDVFAYFEQKGFKKYTLTNLSFLEQIQLFHQATHIIGTHGSNMTNIIFCNPDTQIIELFQNQLDSSYWFISQQLKFQHHCIKVAKSISGDRYISTDACLDTIKRYISQTLPEL